VKLVSLLTLPTRPPCKASITITRGKEKGQHYLRIRDDGAGIPRDEAGLPDFQYVATHICDSVKRRLKHEDRAGIQGEFGIGLLSFWTLGEGLVLTSAGADGRTYEMRMGKGDPRYTISERRRLFAENGTEVIVQPLLPGIRNLSGEKIQWYLASELRDRIKKSGVQIEVVDRQARTQHQVVPRDRKRKLVEENLTCAWEILEGAGELSETGAEIVSFHAPQEPGLTRIGVLVRQGETECRAEALVTVTDALMPELPKSSRERQGLPAYTFQHAPGELWRSRYEEARNLIVINNAHRDFVYASRNRALKLRYICRLYVKELVRVNFPGLAAEHLLERMVELTLYTEEHLK
jgi:hypothetical protein